MNIKKFRKIIFKIIVSPKQEWEVINSEKFNISELIFLFVILLSISSVSLFLGFTLNLGFKLGVGFILSKIAFFALTYAIWFFVNIVLFNYVFNYFDKNNNLAKTIKIISFSSVILLLTSTITNIFVDSSHLFITFLAEVFSVYIFVTGITKLYKLNDNQRFIISVIYSILLLLIFILLKTFQYFI